MRRWILCITALAGVGLLLTNGSLGADEKSKKSEADAKQKLTPAGQILGEVMKVEEGGTSFTLRLHEKTPQIQEKVHRAHERCFTMQNRTIARAHAAKPVRVVTTRVSARRTARAS